jgi:hypothetical protein
LGLFVCLFVLFLNQRRKFPVLVEIAPILKKKKKKKMNLGFGSIVQTIPSTFLSSFSAGGS